MHNFQSYKTKTNIISGSSFREVHKEARKYYKTIQSQSKRRPYVRSEFFNKNKVFLELFWKHLYDKQIPDQVRRLKLLPCAIELIRKSQYRPSTKENPNNRKELLHRFYGEGNEGKLFYVQIKEIKTTDRKWLISVFPETKKAFR